MLVFQLARDVLKVAYKTGYPVRGGLVLHCHWTKTFDLGDLPVWYENKWIDEIFQLCAMTGYGTKDDVAQYISNGQGQGYSLVTNKDELL